MLNEKLFRRLELAFGEGQVGIVNRGKEMQRAYAQAERGRASYSKARKRLVHESPGEEYRVNCCFCGDTRKRLYINHRWALYDPRSGTRNLWLAQCWNEQCLSDYATQRRLFHKVYGNGPTKEEDAAVADSDGQTTASAPVIIRDPGPVWLLDDMLRRSPGHPVLRYLEDRFFDPAYLARQFGVGYILESEYPLARNRIYAPVVIGGKLVGWQCRRASDTDDGTPKWWSCPGMAKGTFFYNFDNAIQYQTKVIVEGPPDVWGFGRQAMGLLGKAISMEQADLVSQVVGPDDAVVVMLDPDQPSNEHGKLHHIERAVQQLERFPNLKDKVVPVYLPDGRDPGDMDRLYMRRLIANTAHEFGVRVSFRKAQ